MICQWDLLLDSLHGIEIVLALILVLMFVAFLAIRRGVKSLESIAESLEQMPAAKEYRIRARQAGRKVA
jgi:hypothetical protein